MKIASLVIGSSVNHWPRQARQVIVIGGAILLAATAAAQNAISTYAGAALTPGNTNTDTGPATLARFSTPQGVALDTNFNLYIADSVNGMIRKITPAGVVSTIATGLTNPGGVAVDTAGNVYVANTGAHTIEKISGGVKTVIAGSSGLIGQNDNATGTLARFWNPKGIAVSGDGAVAYVADTNNHTIRKLTLSGNIAVETIAGTAASTAVFNLPYAVALNANGTLLYVADFNNNAIRQVNLGSGNTVSTYAGTVGTSGSTDSPGLFNHPTGVAVDAAGVLYVADQGNNTIRKIAAANSVATLAGVAGSSGITDGVGTAARFNAPFGIAVRPDGTAVYISDSLNHTIRRGAAAQAPGFSQHPANAAVQAGASVSFTVVATGSPTPTLQWYRNDVAISGATNATYTISSVTSAHAGSYKAVATNLVSSATSNAATLTVTEAPQITNAQTSFSFLVGSTSSSFTVTATGSPAPKFNVISGSWPDWLQLDTNTGVISLLYAIPSSAAGASYTFRVRANNDVGTAAEQNFTLTVQSGPIITAHPAARAVAVGQSATFNVTATGNPAPSSYQWYRIPYGGSSTLITNDYIYYSGANTQQLVVSGVTQSMSGDQFYVVVSNGIGQATSNAATLTVAQSPTQFTSASSTTFVAGQTGTFIFQANGSPAPTYTHVSGTMPYWLTLDPNTGVLSTNTSIPTEAGGQQYQFTVRASNGGVPLEQFFTVYVSATPLAPQITSQPVSQSVALGQNVSFTVTATGTPSPTYQWYRYRVGDAGFVALYNDGTYSGATSPTLTISSVNSAMANDQYRVVASNSYGSVSSNSVQLNVTVGSMFATIAGQAGFTGSTDGTGSSARFDNPYGVAVDAAGNAYVADSVNHTIRKVTANGVVTTLAGLAGVAGSLDGVGASARFNSPRGVAVDATGNVYVADTGNHTIRFITPAGSVSTYAGSPLVLGSADGLVSTARFAQPSGVAVDVAGNVYVADTLNHTIRKISSGTIVTTLAGSVGGPGNIDGTGTLARFWLPTGITVDRAYNVYVADTQNHTIRKITIAGQVTTIAGIASTPGSNDGILGVGRLSQPQGVAVDNSGYVYIADSGNHTIRRVNVTGEIVTLAGMAGASGSADGSGSTARFSQPYGIAVDSSGNIYVADTLNHTIRRSGGMAAAQIVTQPANRFAVPGGTASFTVTASGTPAPGYQWQRRAAGSGGFVNLNDVDIYSGTNTATLTISNLTNEMHEDQFRVIVSNLVGSAVTSSEVTLYIGDPPTFTSPAKATFRVGQAGSMTVAATSAVPVTYSATNLPSWLSLNATTGVLSGTPPDTSGSPFTLTLNAHLGTGTSAAATQTFVLTVEPATVPPSIGTQPSNAVVNQGQAATFNVVATGTDPLRYQWRRDGAPINGATGGSYTVANAQASHAGVYSVLVSNDYGSQTSSGATLTVNTAPVIQSQPRSQLGQSGSTVEFTAPTAGAGVTYQWRKDGVAIPGATGSTLTLSGISASDAANYDVLVTNSLGSVISSLAQLTIVSNPVAPTFTLQPRSQTLVAGGTLRLTAAAAAAPAASYQWRRNGSSIGGATNATLTVPNAQFGDAGNYDVVATNSAGSTSSATAVIRVISRSYAGIYFGNFGGNVGSFAMLVREDNTGVFLGYAPGSAAPVLALDIGVNDVGQFTFSQAAVAAAATNSDEPPRAAALGPVTVSGTIGSSGSVSGSITGGVNTSLSGTRAADSGSTQNLAGFYQAGAPDSGAAVYTIASATGQAFAVVQSGAASDGGMGTINEAGTVGVATGRSAITESIVPSSGTLMAVASGAVNGSFTGAHENVLATQRLLNLSSRARVGSGEAVAIAGFVISGQEAKPVLIRAVGPTLGQAPFNVPGVLANPRLELFRGAASIGSNSGVSTAPNRDAITAAAQRIQAFALGSSGNDSAILTTLPPGAYTAIVSSATTNTGVVLLEVYDLSAAAAGQKLLNISTRGTAGSAENTLIAGVVVSGSAPKRVLIRAVGPGLAPFGVTGFLAQPTLTLYNQAGQPIVANTNWTTSPDASRIGTASASVGAFGMMNQDSAIIATLAPGNYTAQVSGPGTATGVALIEVYELP